MSKIKVKIPTTAAECVGEGCEKRSSAINKANEWTRKTDMQHNVVKLSDGKWYVYNAVLPQCRVPVSGWSNP
jgi:hypothetical protein